MSASEEQGFSHGRVMHGWKAKQRLTKLSIPQLTEELYLAIEERGGVGDISQVHNAHLIGLLCAKLGPQLDVDGNRFSRRRAKHLALTLADHPKMDWAVLDGGVFVDFGCGGLNPFAGMAVLLAGGASRCIGVDLDPLDLSLALPSLAKTAMELIASPSLFLPPSALTGEQVRSNLQGLDLRALELGQSEALGVAEPSPYLQICLRPSALRASP